VWLLARRPEEPINDKKESDGKNFYLKIEVESLAMGSIKNESNKSNP